MADIVAYLIAEGGIPTKMRAAYLDDSQIDYLAGYAAQIRPHLSEFDALPRLGSRDFRTKEAREEETKNMSNFELWRSERIEREKTQGVLWSAAHVRGCVIVKFGAPDVEAGKEWLGSMLMKEGTVDARFGEEALMCLR